VELRSEQGEQQNALHILALVVVNAVFVAAAFARCIYGFDLQNTNFNW
jgi:hypothetical protein